MTDKNLLLRLDHPFAGDAWQMLTVATATATSIAGLFAFDWLYGFPPGLGALTGAAIASIPALYALRELYRRSADSDHNVGVIIERLPGAIIVFDDERRILTVNSRYFSMYGLPRGSIVKGMTEKQLRAVRQRYCLPIAGDQQLLRISSSTQTGSSSYEDWDLPDGRTIRMSVYPMETGGMIAHHEDITDQLRQQEQLESAYKFMDVVVDNVPSAILVKDAQTLRYTLVNRAAEKLHGRNRNALLGKTSVELFDSAQAERILERDKQAIDDEHDGSKMREDRLTVFGQDNHVIQSWRSVVRDYRGRATHLLTVIHDVTQQRNAEEDVRFLAMHDPLTRLYNRAWYSENLPARLAVLQDGQTMALAILDLDGFKAINDTFGHAAGDFVLRHVGESMNSCLTADDVAIRLGGDEFAIVFGADRSEDDVNRSLAGIVQKVQRPVAFEQQSLSVGMSAGVSFGSGGSTDHETLTRQADIALYEAKANGKGHILIFQASMMAKWLHRKFIENDLREAVRNRQFVLHYQPIVNADSGEVVSMEALVRWLHPERGLIPPNDFIPIAEETGLIVAIGELVMEEACHTAAAWPAHVRVSVNLSPVQFRDRNLSKKILSIIQRSGIDSKRLEIEITEATLLCDNSEIMLILKRLRATGVRVVMDDFGAGYSSLNYIRNFPFDKIKIDKSYVDGLLMQGDSSGSILHAVFGLAQDLKLDTTAEGVECAEQMQRLIQEGCTEMQGYYFSKPMPADDAAKLFGLKTMPWKQAG